ncbi:MAG: CHASE3 domain-containing protein, partial [Bacteroidetes bacterium]|nr:CHASE3 domain-containing protein [Bacteroidota bacterium]
MKSKLVRNLQAGFGLSLLLLVAVSVASYISIHNLLESARRVDHSKLVISKLEYVLSTMKDAETGQRGYLLTANDEFLLPYTGSQKKALYTIDEFKRLTADNPQQQANADNIKTIIQNRLGILQIVLDKKKAGGAIVAEDLLAGKSAMDELRQAVRRAEADENKLLDERIATLSNFVSLTPAFIILSTLGAIGITIFSYARVMGGIS